jgi:hypothetical protein
MYGLSPYGGYTLRMHVVVGLCPPPAVSGGGPLRGRRSKPRQDAFARQRRMWTTPACARQKRFRMASFRIGRESDALRAPRPRVFRLSMGPALQTFHRDTVFPSSKSLARARP